MNAARFFCWVVAGCAAAAMAGCTGEQSPPQKTSTPKQVVSANQIPSKRRAPLKKPPVLPPEQVLALDQAADLMIAKKYDEALEICRSFAKVEVFQYLELFAKLSQARARGEMYVPVHPTSGRELLEYCLSTDSPNEFIIALLKDTSLKSMAYPLMDVLERRAEEGLIESSPQLDERLLAILHKNDPDHLRKVTARALHYWDWDTNEEVFFNLRNALYSIKIMGYIGNPRYIDPLRAQYEIYRDENERPLNLLPEALRIALRRLGVTDLDQPKSLPKE